MTYRQIRKYNSNDLAYVDYKDPDTCPCCGRPTVPYFVSAICETEKHMSVFYVCQSCRSSFISRFELFGSSEDRSADFIDSVPVSPQKVIFSKELMQLSPRFCEIFNQAKVADEYGLVEICGLGYRKAIEFLVKDYCIHKDPEHKDDISKEHLKSSIDRLDNERLISLGHAIRILGNDETHYIFKESEGMDEMKNYISSLVSFVQFSLDADHAENLYMEH